MKTMLTQINEKRASLQNNESDPFDEQVNILLKVYFKIEFDIYQIKFKKIKQTNEKKRNMIDLKLEQDRFLIAEKKMQMIHFQSFIDVLQKFNGINFRKNT